MRLVVLGSGTLLPDPHRGSPSFWVEAGGATLLLDCGSGAVRAMGRLGLPWAGLSHIAVSHFHTDHVGDLAAVLWAFKHGLSQPRTDPLHLLGPEGLQAHLEHLARAHGEFILDPGFPLRVVEMAPGDRWRDPLGRLEMTVARTRHTEESLALRIESPEGVLGYTGDTGALPPLGPFLAGCGLLVAECAHRDGEGWEGHLTPLTLSQLAIPASPGLLLTVHAYPPLDPEAVPALLASHGFPGPVRAARDGMAVVLTPLGASVEGE